MHMPRERSILEINSDSTMNIQMLYDFILLFIENSEGSKIWHGNFGGLIFVSEILMGFDFAPFNCSVTLTPVRVPP